MNLNNDGYMVQTLFQPEEIDHLKAVYERRNKVHFHQCQNLFDVYQSKVIIETALSLNPVKRVCENYFAGFTLDDCVFLEYGVGSFVKMHADKPEVKMSVITVLDNVSCVGGETILMLPYHHKPRKATSKAIRCHDEPPPYGQEIRPKVINLTNQDSLIIGSNVKHGMGDITHGKRLVFLMWFV